MSLTSTLIRGRFANMVNALKIVKSAKRLTANASRWQDSLQRIHIMNWISVKDKLPENRVGKIVFSEGDGITMMYYDPEKKYWISRMGFDRYDVTHWMELPNPPSVPTQDAGDKVRVCPVCGGTLIVKPDCQTRWRIVWLKPPCA